MNYCHVYIMLCVCFTHFCGLSESRYSAIVMPKCDFLLRKKTKYFFAYYLEFMLARYQYFNVKNVRNLRLEHFESYSSFSYCAHSSVYWVFWPSGRVVD